MLLMEKTDDARSDFEKAVELNPNFPIAVVQKCYTDYRHAMQAQDVGVLMKSLQDFREAIIRFPSCPETYILFAQVRIMHYSILSLNCLLAVSASSSHCLCGCFSILILVKYISSDLATTKNNCFCSFEVS